MRADEIVDLTSRGATVDPAHDLVLLDQDEGGNLGHVELTRQGGVRVGVDVDHSKASLLGHLHPRHEALHAPRHAACILVHEEESREARFRLRPRRGATDGTRSHAAGVPPSLDRETNRTDMRGASVRRLPRQTQAEPVPVRSLGRIEGIDERVEDPRQGLVQPSFVGERAHADDEAIRGRLRLERDGPVAGDLEDAEHGELQVVDALVWEVESASDAPEDERSDPSEGRCGRHREDYLVAHRSFPAPPASPTLAGVARAGDVDVTRETVLDGVVVVRVEGELDLATCVSFENVIGEIDLGQRLVIDLTQCTFLDSSAVRVLVTTVRSAQGAEGSVSLVATDPGILRVLEIAGVDTMLSVHPSVDDAISS